MSDCFELLRVDVWGMYREPSLSGANYLITILTITVELFGSTYSNQKMTHIITSLISMEL